LVKPTGDSIFLLIRQGMRNKSSLPYFMFELDFAIRIIYDEIKQRGLLMWRNI